MHEHTNTIFYSWIEYWYRKQRQYVCRSQSWSEDIFSAPIHANTLHSQFHQQTSCNVDESRFENELREVTCSNKNSDQLIEVNALFLTTRMQRTNKRNAQFHSYNLVSFAYRWNVCGCAHFLPTTNNIQKPEDTPSSLFRHMNMSLMFLPNIFCHSHETHRCSNRNSNADGMQHRLCIRPF